MTEIGELAYCIGGKVTLEVEEGKKQEIVKAFRGHSRKCKLQTDHGVWQSARRRATEYEAEYFENIRQAIEGSVEKKERHPRDQWRRKGGITHAQALDVRPFSEEGYFAEGRNEANEQGVYLVVLFWNQHEGKHCTQHIAQFKKDDDIVKRIPPVEQVFPEQMSRADTI
ncbi:MAG: hypothetical protein Q9162_001202 [Coniocarpon cinnabarinum]